MDRDLDRLHDLARGIIKQQFDRERALQAAGDPAFSDSRLKKIRKVMTQLDQNHKIYANEMETILTEGGSAQQMGDKLRSAIRGVEEYALEAFQLLQDDSVHHKVQSRTGGDTLIEAPGDRVRRVMARLEDHFGMQFGNAFGPGGNLTAEYSLSNRAHKFDERARGLERESGIGKEPTKATTAHPRSTAGSSRNLTPAQLADDDSLFEALRANIEQQLADSAGGQATDAARQSLVRDLADDPMTYNPAATAEDVARSKARLAGKSAEDIVGTYQEGFGLARNGGAMRLVRQSRVARALPVVGTALSAATVELNRAARAEEIEQNPNDPTLHVNKALDEVSGWADRAALGSLATGIGAPAAIPLEAVSTGASLLSLAFDGGRALLKQMQKPLGENAEQMPEWERRQRSRMGAY